MTIVAPNGFTSFGTLLRYLRRRAQLSQRDLAIAAGYSESQISRLEQNQRKPDLSAVLALVLPALDLEAEPELTARLIELAGAARNEEPEPAEALPTSSPALAGAATQDAVEPPPFIMPVQSTPCIGRAEEIATLRELLAQPQCRLLTIVGPGGSGKTRVALEVAAASAAHFADGAHAVMLAGVPAVELIGPAIAEALQLTFSTGADALLHLRTYLRDKSLLLLLDNMEHLAGGVEMLMELLAAAPGVKLLITSRERMQVRDEWVFDLPGLAVPAAAAGEDLTGWSAIQLFQAHAQRVAPGFAPSEEDQQHIAGICRFVGGLPLAIELAAGWVRVLSCEQILAELTHNVDLLQTSLRDMPARHRTMRAVFDQSWALLTAEEQRVLRGLAVFRGGFGHAAAAAVAGASLPVLAALVDKSLLHRTAPDRYDMHDLLHHYAAEQLAMLPGEAEQTRARHCRYYATVLQEWTREVREGSAEQPVTTIDSEIDNLRAAWGWAVKQEDIADIAQLVDGLFWFYLIHGWYHEGLDVFGRALARLAVSNPEHALLRGMLLVRCGRFRHCLSHDITLTRQALTRGLALLVEASAAEEIAQAHGFLGDVARSLGEYQKATRYYQESLSIYTAHGDQGGVANALTSLGLSAWDHGEYSEAAWFFHESLAIYKTTGNRTGIASVLSFLGSVSLETGAYDEAIRYTSESLVQSQALGARWGKARALNTLGNVAKVQGTYPRARQYYQESLAICRAINDCWAIAKVQTNLGAVTAVLGDWATATQLCQESLALCRATSYRWGTIAALHALGTIALGQGDEQGAKAHLQAALSGALDIRALSLIGEILVSLATLLIREERHAEAGKLLAIALHHPASQPHVRQRAAQLVEQAGFDPPLPELTPAQARAELGQLGC